MLQEIAMDIIRAALREVIPAKRSESSCGFTLIELLVVVAIIALLVAILIPALEQARDQAKSSVCAHSVRQIGLSFFTYTNDYQGYLPYGFVDYAVTDTFEWERALAPYLSFVDPGGPGWGPPENKEYWADTRFGDKLICPASMDYPGTIYGCNYGTVFPFSGYKAAPPGHSMHYPRAGIKLMEISTSTFLITDGDIRIYSPYNWAFDYDADGDGLDDTATVLHASIDYNCGFPTVHMNGANYLFASGSASWVSMKDWERNDGNIWGDPITLK